MSEEQRTINMKGDRPVYIEKNDGTVYVGDYVSDASEAFEDISFDVENCVPTIDPPIARPETELLYNWIHAEYEDTKQHSVALISGKAGIGKSVILHDLYEKIHAEDGLAVMALKSDQVEFRDMEDLRRQMHLALPLDKVLKELSSSYKRVVLLIDQIDALSLSLSNNRAPLRSLLKLVERVRGIENIRIVISCRPYDLEYDPVLSSMRVDKRIEIKEFSVDVVKTTLKDYAVTEELSEPMLTFLGNPLHLFLYLKARKHCSDFHLLSESVLYEQLWRTIITDSPKIATTRLVEALDVVLNQMYDTQTLSVHRENLMDGYKEELQYLLHNEIFIQSKNKIQFFHQTLFDYAFAKRFVDTGKDLLQLLDGVHQGLFIRSMVKSVMAYMRSTKPQIYNVLLRSVLFDNTEDGRSKYRYHLKALLLSSMAYYDAPLDEELLLIERHLLKKENLALFDVLVTSVSTWEWMFAIYQIVTKNSGWKELDSEMRKRMLDMSVRLMWSNCQKAVDFLNGRFADDLSDEDWAYLCKKMSFRKFECGTDSLILLYQNLCRGSKEAGFGDILEALTKDAPDFVIDVLKADVQAKLETCEHKYDSVRVGYDIEHVYDTLEKYHPELMFPLYLSILGKLLDADSIDVESYDIKLSYQFMHFEAESTDSLRNDFGEAVIKKLMRIVRDRVSDDNDTEIVETLAELYKSEYDGFVFLALYGYSQNAERFKNELYHALTNRKVLGDAPSMVQYQAREALGIAFPFFRKEQKDSIVELVLHLDSKYEQQHKVNGHLEHNVPITFVDHGKGVLLKKLEPYIRNDYRQAYLKLQELERKFRSLENTKPISGSVMSGWPSMTKEKADKMDAEAWYGSMQKYTTDNNFDWNIPSITGQKHLFEAIVAENPDKFVDLMVRIIEEDKVSLGYAVAGVRGLVAANKLDTADKVLRLIFDRLKKNLTYDGEGFSLFELLNTIDSQMKKNHLSNDAFEFICKVLRDYPDEDDEEYLQEKDIYQRGINTARGNAGYMLVTCVNFKEYRSRILDALEEVAETASITTRSAILLNMACLGVIDRDRNLQLFLKLNHDYAPQLMSMPVHNYNPLVYMVNYGFDSLIPYFEHAVDVPSCHDVIAVLLLLAWLHTSKTDAERLLWKALETEEGRVSLVQFVARQETLCSDEKLVQILLALMDTKYTSERMASTFDTLFMHADNWETNTKLTLTEAFVESDLPRYSLRSFYEYLAALAVVYPEKTLVWMEKVLSKYTPEEYYEWNRIFDILIQCYNGISKFNDPELKPQLERTMDMIDEQLMNSNTSIHASSFLMKLDNE